MHKDDGKWIHSESQTDENSVPAKFKDFFCFFLDETKLSLIGLIIPRRCKDNFSISCRDDHPVYQKQCLEDRKYTTARPVGLPTARPTSEKDSSPQTCPTVCFASPPLYPACPET